MLLVFSGLASSLQTLRRAREGLHDSGLGRDDITLFGTRLEGIRRDLPRYGEVGYVADPPIEFSNGDFVRELVWTRYWLAPLVVLPYWHQHLVIAHDASLGAAQGKVVLPDWHQHLVIGNFHKPVSTGLLSEWHLVLLKDYGNGMMLFVGVEQ